MTQLNTLPTETFTILIVYTILMPLIKKVIMTAISLFLETKMHWNILHTTSKDWVTPIQHHPISLTSTVLYNLKRQDQTNSALLFTPTKQKKSRINPVQQP